MIARNVAAVMRKQNTAKVALTEKDEKVIKEKGVEGWVKSEFGVTDQKAIESAYAGIREASPEITALEDKKPDEPKHQEPKHQEPKHQEPKQEHDKKHWWDKKE